MVAFKRISVVLFKKLSDCLNQSLRKVCSTPQFDVTVSRFGLTRSLQMSVKQISWSIQGLLSHMAVIRGHELFYPPRFFARRGSKEIVSCQNILPSYSARRPFWSHVVNTCYHKTSKPRNVGRFLDAPLHIPGTSKPVWPCKIISSNFIASIFSSVGRKETLILQALILVDTLHHVIRKVLMNVVFQAWIFESLSKAVTSVVTKRLLGKSIECNNTSLPIISNGSLETDVTRRSTLKRKRDREPSRIPIRRVVRLLKKRSHRKNAQYVLRQCSKFFLS